MSESLVPTVRTTPTTPQFIHALAGTWPEVIQKQAAVIWAQWALETGTGKFCCNWNLGNVKHVKGDGYDYMALKGVWEIVNGKRIELPPENPGSWFRALPSLDEGMHDHIALIRDKRFRAAWPAVLAGDPIGFARILKEQRYYTASLESYSALMAANFNAFMRATASDVPITDTIAEQEIKAPGWTTVYIDGEEYEVRSEYIAPVGIDEAVETARYFGCTLPTKKMVDAIWQAADVKIQPIQRSVDNGLLKDWGASMASKETFDDQRQRIARAVIAASGTAGFELLAGTHKDIVYDEDTGKVGIYGWHRLDGSVIQDFNSTAHPLGSNYKDYSQGLRLMRRVPRFEVVHPDVPFEPKTYNFDS